MEHTQFVSCSLKEVDFSVSDLTGAIFEKTDLSRAQFSKSILEKADFRSAQNYGIDPFQNKMKGAVFTKDNLEGLVKGFGVKVVDS